MRERIYRQLIAAGGYISGETLSGPLGITRAALWKHIRAMQADGAVIDSAPKRGYRLVSPPEVPRAAYVRAHIHHDIPVLYKPLTTSTNDDARAAAQQMAHGVFIAGQQTAGKGRKGRTWVSEPGDGVYLSFLVRTKAAPEQAAGLTLAAAVALCRAIESVADVQARIKWPNDIIIGGKKAAGILTESMLHMDGVEFIVCGIGINTRTQFAGALSETATGISANGTLLAAAVIDHVLDTCEQFEQNGLAPFIDAFRRRSAISGIITVTSAAVDEQGELAGFDDSGALLLRCGSQTKRFVAGEVTLRGEKGYV